LQIIASIDFFFVVRFVAVVADIPFPISIVRIKYPIWNCVNLNPSASSEF